MHHCCLSCNFCTRPPAPAALESPTVGDQAVTDAASHYLSLLLGLTSTFSAKPADGGSAAAAEAAAGSPDEALAAAEAGASSAAGAASPLAAPASKLRHAGAWEWGDAALVALPPGTPPRKAASSDAVFELAQVGPGLQAKTLLWPRLPCTHSGASSVDSSERGGVGHSQSSAPAAPACRRCWWPRRCG